MSLVYMCAFIINDTEVKPSFSLNMEQIFAFAGLETLVTFRPDFQAGASTFLHK